MTAPAATSKRITRKRRTQITRVSQVLGLILVIVVLALIGEWAAFFKSFFNVDTIGKTASRMFTTGLKNTLIYAVSAFIYGLVLGVIIALMRLSEVRLYRWLSTIYVEIFRGLPALLVLLMVNFGIPLVFPNSELLKNFYIRVAIGLGSVAAAYISETVRAGIQAVPKGQMEAARTLGMSSGRAMRSIILPQAFRVIIPPMTNEVILLLKDSSLVYALGVTTAQYELTKLGQSFSAGNVAGIPAGATPLVLGGLFYLLVTLPLSQAVRRLEIQQAKRR